MPPSKKHSFDDIEDNDAPTQTTEAKPPPMKVAKKRDHPDFNTTLEFQESPEQCKENNEILEQLVEIGNKIDEVCRGPGDYIEGVRDTQEREKEITELLDSVGRRMGIKKCSFDDMEDENGLFNYFPTQTMVEKPPMKASSNCDYPDFNTTLEFPEPPEQRQENNEILEQLVEIGNRIDEVCRGPGDYIEQEGEIKEQEREIKELLDSVGCRLGIVD